MRQAVVELSAKAPGCFELFLHSGGGAGEGWILAKKRERLLELDHHLVQVIPPV